MLACAVCAVPDVGSDRLRGFSAVGVSEETFAIAGISTSCTNELIVHEAFYEQFDRPYELTLLS
jgi:hypothetical protein